MLRPENYYAVQIHKLCWPKSTVRKVEKILARNSPFRAIQRWRFSEMANSVRTTMDREKQVCAKQFLSELKRNVHRVHYSITELMSRGRVCISCTHPDYVDEFSISFLFVNWKLFLDWDSVESRTKCAVSNVFFRLKSANVSTITSEFVSWLHCYENTFKMLIIMSHVIKSEKWKFVFRSKS